MVEFNNWFNLIARALPPDTKRRKINISLDIKENYCQAVLKIGQNDPIYGEPATSANNAFQSLINYLKNKWESSDI